jgi:hypothetical protein
MNHSNRHSVGRLLRRVWAEGLGQFARNTQGATLVEFLFAFPVLLLLAFVILEFSTYQLARIRTDKAAYQIASIITQLDRSEVKPIGQPSYFTVEGSQIDAVLDRADFLVPHATRTGLKVVVSGFVAADRVFPVGGLTAQPVNSPLLLWAKGRVFGTNPRNSPSTISQLGSNIVWSSGLAAQPIQFLDTYTTNAISTYGAFRCPENVVLVEVFYEYTPIFTAAPIPHFISRQTLVSRAFLRPRAGDIEAIAGDSTFAIPMALYQHTKARGGFCN